MPRRKKNGQSPARVPSGPPEGGSLGHNTDYRLPQPYDGPMANNFPSSSTSSEKENIVKNMQEMFSHLDPEVIYIVLSECDFKVENAMDSLLELSVAAEDAVPVPVPVSGFERTAAALLSPAHFSEPRANPDSYKPSSRLPSSSSTVLSEELDLLIDQELQTLTTQQDGTKEHYNSRYLSAASPPSPDPPPHQVLPELLQSSLEPGSRGSSNEHPPPLRSSLDQASGASSPLDQLSAFEGEATERQQSVLDFKHLMTETSADKPLPPLDLGTSGRPSAFQVYKKQNPSHTVSERAEVMASDARAGGARSKVNTLNQEIHAHVPLSWNLEAPVFFPHIHGHQGPAFITPVASNWPSHPRHPSPWLSHGPVSHTPLRPSPTIPRSWALPAAPQLPGQCNRLRLEGRVLVLLRGAPGSGKSTIARALLEHNPGGVILSTDNYFTRHGVYHFDPTELGEAHSWNHKQAKEAFERGANPIIIDNTNMQGWEMKPYVILALNYKYKVLFREPDTWWKNKPRELERRTIHNVSAEKIRRMLNGYERFVTVPSIMGSQMPEEKQCLILENRRSQPASSQTPCPDLVGEPGLTEGSKKSHPQLFSSLPDVSSIGHSADVGTLRDSSHKSTESLNFQPTERPLENPENSDGDDMDLGDLDSELDAQLELNQPSGDQRIPDCIVESVMNEELCRDDLPVAFSESIGQRVRRERTSRRSGFDRLEPADLVKDTNQSESAKKEKEKTEEDEGERVEMLRESAEVLHFVGDWPSEGSLEQRQVRKRERLKEENDKEGGGMSREDNENNTIKVQSKHDVAEFQKLLDLIQTGVADIQTGSSLPSSLSPTSGEELETDMETGGRFEDSHGSRLNREDNMNRVNSSRGELPDCVLDWKAADSCMVREPLKLRTDDWEHLKTESEANSSGGNDDLLEMAKETESLDSKTVNLTSSLSAITADSVVIPESAEAEGCHNEVGSSIKDVVGAGLTGIETNSCTETRTEADSNISEVCQSPEFEGFVEVEGSPLGGASANQEPRQRQGRRSGKQCKLALTFTQNCPDFSVKSPECVTLTTQNINASQDTGHTDLQTSSHPGLNPKLNTVKSDCEADLQHTVHTGCVTQTESQDFALLWRLNHQNNPDDKVAAAYIHSSDITVIYGNPSRFVPELSCAIPTAAAIQPSGHKEVPYRVVHEKSTQVEEKEFGATQDRLESLRILSRHFKLVSFDTLEDLYDKCHQDLEWTTNLLLDSGERFFRDDDGEEEEEKEERSGDPNKYSVHGALGMVEENILRSNMFDELQFESSQVVASESSMSSKKTNGTSIFGFTGAASPMRSKDGTDTSLLSAEVSLLQAVSKGDGHTEPKMMSQPDLEGGAWGLSLDGGVIIEETGVETEDDISSMDEIHRLLQAELEELEREQKQKEEERSERRHMEQRRSRHMDIKSVELKLPTELALQLTELFGPVGVDPGACSADDYAVQMDLNLAKLLHQKWKETIQERQRQAALSFHLLQESSAEWGKSQVVKSWPRELTQPGGNASLDSHPDGHGHMPFMDHWNVSRQHVSLRDIIKEEQRRQENMEKVRQSRTDLDKRDGATLLKENQLYSRFPTIDRHFLLDIFRDHNYSLTQTELFLHSLLDEEPVKTVIAPEAPRADHHRAASKEREKRQKPLEAVMPLFQDTEDPEYQDFRAEANLQRKRQLESFSKAAEAYKQGHKEVASFYAQQGHLHGQRMREANHRAAVQIFERVNASLLPRNILDLHGLHVDEAVQHLAQVLEDKTTDCEQGLCRPQLSVITGRGNHSQGGVARIRPAVIDYLTNKHYRFTEPKPGLVLVSLK